MSSIESAGPARIARMQSLYRRFTRERIARRKAGGGYDARSARGLQALGFHDHSLPHNPHKDFLKKILLADVPVAYHTKSGVNGFHVAAQLGNLRVLDNIISTGVSAKTIISRGKIDPRRRTKDGLSALHFAALSDKDDPRIIEKVLEAMLLTMPPQGRELALPEALSVLTRSQRNVAQIVLQRAESGLNVLGYCALSGNRRMMLYLLRGMGCNNSSAEAENTENKEKEVDNANGIAVAKYSLEMNVTCDGSLQRLQHIVCYNADPDTLETLLAHGLVLTGVLDADGKNVYHHLAGSWRASATERLSRTFKILRRECKGGGISSSSSGSGGEDPIRARTIAEGQTALHLACSAGATAVAKMLLEVGGGFGGSVTDRDLSGATPVMLLLKHRFKARKQMELLSQILSSLPSRQTWWDDHLCGRTGQSLATKACEWRNMVALRIVLDTEGAGGVDSIDRAGKTALHHCCEFGWKAGIETLLLYGASLDAQDNEGSTPLMLAIGANDTATVDLLLDVARSKDRMEREEEEEEEERLIIIGRDENIAEELKEEEEEEEEAGADETSRDNQGNNAGSETKEEKADPKASPSSHLLNLLSRHRNLAGLNCILLSAIMPTTKMLTRMMTAAAECGCSLGALVSSQGNNLLHCAAAGGSADVVRMIEQYDYNMALHLARQRNEKAKLPKHIAKYWKHYEALTALMDLEPVATLPTEHFARLKTIREKRSGKK
jgi:ankyrin repeat protein